MNAKKAHPTQTAMKAKQSAAGISRYDAATIAIQQLVKVATLDEVNAKADALYVQHGGESNVQKTLGYTKGAVQAAQRFGLVSIERTTIIRPARQA